MSKIEAGKFTLEEAPLSIRGILDNIGSMVGERARRNGLEIVVEAPSDLPDALGDAARIQQALLNFVGNAIKFTERGRVVIRAAVTAATADALDVRFEVEDTGVGVEPEAMKRLFTTFEQADNSTMRKYGGTGLGLAITKKLAELMGGTAGAVSAPGRGSPFWFTVQLKPNWYASQVEGMPPDDSAEAVLKIHFAGKRILLMEDEPINREVAMMLLSDIGFVIASAPDGVLAIERTRQQAFDLILMDMQMPVMDGLEATREIRRDPAYRSVPILAMTANAFAEDRERCFEAGMNDYITKPVAPDRLFTTLLKWLSRDQ